RRRRRNGRRRNKVLFRRRRRQLLRFRFRRRNIHGGNALHDLFERRHGEAAYQRITQRNVDESNDDNRYNSTTAHFLVSVSHPVPSLHIQPPGAIPAKVAFRRPASLPATAKFSTLKLQERQSRAT